MAADPDRVDVLFHAAMNRGTPAERQSFLDAARGSDRELREAVRGRLTAHDAPDRTTDSANPTDRAGPADIAPTLPGLKRLRRLKLPLRLPKKSLTPSPEYRGEKEHSARNFRPTYRPPRSGIRT